jgi:hypothetical protein
MNKVLIGFVTLILLVIIIFGVIYTGGIQIGGTTFLGLDKIFNFPQFRQTNQEFNNRGFQGQNRSDVKMNPANQNPMNSQPAISQAPIVLKNIESLNKAMGQLNDAIKLIQLEPYSDDEKQSNSQNITNVPEAASDNKSVSQTTTPQNGTVINIFPNNTSTEKNSILPSLKNTGLHYDPVKMEQLNSKLYKVAYGMELIRQLNDEFTMQTEIAGANLQNPSIYYQNFYNITIINKMKLNQALAYINEAEDLVNINPYISSSGLIFDRERMRQVHSGIFKLAEGVAQLTLLNSDLLKQSVSISSLYQNYISTTTSNDINMGSAGNMLFSGNGTIDMRILVNLIIIAFVILLFIGLLGFIVKLFKKI